MKNKILHENSPKSDPRSPYIEELLINRLKQAVSDMNGFDIEYLEGILGSLNEKYLILTDISVFQNDMTIHFSWRGSSCDFLIVKMFNK
ncbi:hypothetical protein [Viscerimonas tarda]